MPQNASITINDGKATPQAHVFLPNRITADNVAEFVENDSQPLGMQPSMTWSIRKPVTSGPTSTYKATGVVKIPRTVTQVINGVSSATVVNTTVGRVELSIPVGCTLAERKDIRVLCANLLLNATIAASNDNAESFW